LFKKSSILAISLCFAALLTSCSAASQDNLPKPKDKIPIVINPGSDTYEETTDEMVSIDKEAISIESPSPREENQNSSLAKDLCTRVGENAIEFSKIASQDSGSPYIARLLEFELVEDNRRTAKKPSGDTVIVVIECRVQIEISTGDRGSVTIYELLDSKGQTRVRWDDYAPE
jgi:hypothetical protein